jgi:hypothetical protein
MQRIARGIAVVALAGLAWWLIGVRHSLIHAVTTYDAAPTDPASLPAGTGAGLSPAARVRVVLIDGLSARVAHDLPAWSALCKRGLDLRVDVGFPTVSLPVEAALWTGLTQQQTGIVYRSDVPIVPPLADSIPAKLAGSIAIAENHGYIVRSLGFHHVEPPSDDDAKAWEAAWQAHAATAIGSLAPLVFVHILRVDHAGHLHGEASEDYAKVALDADTILATLVAIDPEARWFVLSDHGHLADGGHGGEEREVRQVEGCIAGPGIAPARGELVHVIDVARAIADSTGVTLDHESLARPMSFAIAHPLDPEQAVPATPLRIGAIGIAILLVGLVASWLMARPWWIGPWWFAIACVSLVLIRGEPTLSMRMVYTWEGRTMYLTWLPALALAAYAAYAGLARTTLVRVIAAGLALPVCALIATITVCGAWPTLVGAEVAPVVPRFTAWLSPLVLITAHGAAAVALAVLARLVRSAFGRRSPAETSRTEPAAG